MAVVVSSTTLLEVVRGTSNEDCWKCTSTAWNEHGPAMTSKSFEYEPDGHRARLLSSVNISISIELKSYWSWRL